MLPPLQGPVLGDRSLFPDLEPRAYLAHAGVSPPSIPVRRAVIGHLNEVARRGALYFGSALEQRARLRSKLATLLGAEVDEVALVSNTSLGVTMVALSIPWKAGDGVLCFEGEFPANVTPWQRAAALFSLRFEMQSADRFRTDPDGAWKALDEALARGVRVVAISAVQFQTGLRMPWAEIATRCHNAGAELFVDGIQACGAVPLKVGDDGIDYLVAGGHKWMMGLEGAGVLIARKASAARFHPHLAGWLSHTDAFDFLTEGGGKLRYDKGFVDNARLFEVGTLSSAGYVGLEAGIDLIAQLGVTHIYNHVEMYLDVLEAALVERGFTSLRSSTYAGRSTILGMMPPEGSHSVVKWQKLFAERGVVASGPDGVLRFAPHWPNDRARELPYLLGLVDELLRTP